MNITISDLPKTYDALVRLTDALSGKLAGDFYISSGSSKINDISRALAAAFCPNCEDITQFDDAYNISSSWQLFRHIKDCVDNIGTPDGIEGLISYINSVLVWEYGYVYDFNMFEERLGEKNSLVKRSCPGCDNTLYVAEGSNDPGYTSCPHYNCSLYYDGTEFILEEYTYDDVYYHKTPSGSLERHYDPTCVCGARQCMEFYSDGCSCCYYLTEEDASKCTCSSTCPGSGNSGMDEYYCEGCGELYSTEFEALNCSKTPDCPAYEDEEDPVDYYYCPNCRTEYSSKIDAENCDMYADCPGNNDITTGACQVAGCPNDATEGGGMYCYYHERNQDYSSYCPNCNEGVLGSSYYPEEYCTQCKATWGDWWLCENCNEFVYGLASYCDICKCDINGEQYVGFGTCTVDGCEQPALEGSGLCAYHNENGY